MDDLFDGFGLFLQTLKQRTFFLWGRTCTKKRLKFENLRANFTDEICCIKKVLDINLLVIMAF